MKRVVEWCGAPQKLYATVMQHPSIQQAVVVTPQRDQRDLVTTGYIYEISYVDIPLEQENMADENPEEPQPPQSRVVVYCGGILDPSLTHP